MAHIPMIEKRRIEAEIIKQVYDTLVKHVSEKEARAIIKESVINSAIAQGESFRAEREDDPNLEDFADLLGLWQMEDALQIDVLTRAPDQLDFNVTRCRYAEMYKDMGLEDMGDLLSCNRDGKFCEGYNPKFKMTRTQTIMKGASYCNFRFSMEED